MASTCGRVSEAVLSYGFDLNTCDWTWSWKLNTNNSVAFHVLVCVFYAVSVKALSLWVAASGTSIAKTPRFEKVRRFHNLGLSLISLAMAVVMTAHLWGQGRLTSWHSASCINTPNTGLYGFANLVYLITKIWEWGDTYFLVLSRKPVIFLHWFHHMTTFTMAALTHNFPVGGFCLVNCIVHFVMYLHFAFPFPAARPFITSGQLAQFAVVISIHTYGFVDSSCYDMQPVFKEWLFCQAVVVGFAILFMNFFLQQYLKPARKTKKRQE